MKRYLTLLVVILVFTTTIYSQNSGYVTTFVDDSTQQVISESSTLTITHDSINGFGISMKLSGTNIAIDITAVGAGNCINTGSRIYIQFIDGAKVSLSNESPSNCDNFTSINFKSKLSKVLLLRALSTKEIQTICVFTENGYVEEDLSYDERMIFKSTLNDLIYYRKHNFY